MINYFNELDKNVIPVFVGIISFLISIIIFVAQIISSKDTTITERKAYLKHVKILYLLRESLLLLLECWISAIFKKSDYTMLYIIIELLIYFNIIKLTYGLYKQFKGIIEIFTKEEIKTKVLNSFIFEVINNYKKEKEKIKNRVNNNIKKLDIIMKSNLNVSYGNSGVGYYKVKCYNSGYLDSINIKIINNILKDTNYHTKIIINKKPGSKVVKNDTIFFTNDLRIVNDLNKGYIINTTILEKENELQGVIKDVIFNNQELTLDQNNYFKRLYIDLINKNENEVLFIINDILFIDYRKKHDNNVKISENELFQLNSNLLFYLGLYTESINNNKIDNAIELIKNICIIYKNTVNQVVDSKDYSYFFVNEIINTFIANSTNKKSSKLYDATFSYLLDIIVELLNNELIDEYEIISNNLLLINNNSNYNINVDFIIGLIKLYILLNKKDEKHLATFMIDNRERLIIIYNTLCKKILNINKNIEVVQLFKWISKEAMIKNVIYVMDFKIFKETYKNVYSVFILDFNDLIGYFICNANAIINYNDNFSYNYYNTNKELIDKVYNCELNDDYLNLFDLDNYNYKVFKKNLKKMLYDKRIK